MRKIQPPFIRVAWSLLPDESTSLYAQDFVIIEAIWPDRHAEKVKTCDHPGFSSVVDQHGIGRLGSGFDDDTDSA